MYIIMLTAVFIIPLISSSSFADIIINANTTNYSTFYSFWRNTGFCPPDPKENIPNYLLSDEQQINIALIGSLPNKGITHIRVHWLLNLLSSQQSVDDENITYNYMSMDKYISYLNEHNLEPVFEFMGSSNHLISFEKTQIFWSTLIETTIKRYLERFGVQRVSKWKFETWNEPDLKGYNVLNFNLLEYLNYVNGCSEGLELAFTGTGSKWKLGGPAGLFRDKGHPLCWGLLEICNKLGSSMCPLQFISFHRKGNGTAQGVLNGTLRLLDSFHDIFPNLRTIPVANDEADIEENWSKSLEWRADCRYAAMIVKVIHDLYKQVRVDRKIEIEMLSNDNAFLNYHPFYFSQRTLFARFQINTTTPRHNQFIRKPAYSVMALLSFLENEYLEEEMTDPDPLLTVLTTRSKPGNYSILSVILVYENGSYIDNGNEKVVNIVLTSLPNCKWRFVLYRLDNVNTNPYDVWRRFGRPVFPTGHERMKMREVEEPLRLIGPKAIHNDTLNMTLKLTLPSIHLLHVCCKPEKVPKRVHSLAVFNVTFNEVLITWKYNHKTSKCLRTYEVEIRAKCSPEKDFVRVNPKDTIFLSYQNTRKGNLSCEWTRGNYRVRAVDYWNRPGKYSEIISYP